MRYFAFLFLLAACTFGAYTLRDAVTVARKEAVVVQKSKLEAAADAAVKALAGVKLKHVATCTVENKIIIWLDDTAVEALKLDESGKLIADPNGIIEPIKSRR